ncbi:MAG: thermonuclease family protein [Rhodospirillales bacterium]|nr:thermonuclease family protein [Rhodospirillales bacterium]
MTGRLWAAAVLAVLALSAGPAQAQSGGSETIEGPASVTDGDSIEIDGRRIRLYGIDAPEFEQSCRTAAGRVWRCGQEAAAALAGKIGSAPVTCQVRGNDGRAVAVCRQGGADLNAWLVQQGLALAYRYFSTDYLPEEENARRARRGLWQGAFVKPWNWRRGKRL